MMIAQVTDSHIMPEGQDWRGDPETNVHNRLKRVVAAINALDPKPDMVILTGDNIDSTDFKGAYQNLKSILDSLSVPFWILPGNHDSPKDLLLQFPRQKNTFFYHDLPQVRVIGLDSHVPGRDFGKLGTDQLEWLNKILNSRREIPALIFVHHFPVSVGLRGFDQLRLRNAEDLEKIINFYPHVIGTICGHLHNQFSSTFAGRPLYISPSVAPNFYFKSSNDAFPARLNLDPPQFSLHKVFGFNFWSKVVSVVRPERTLGFVQR